MTAASTWALRSTARQRVCSGDTTSGVGATTIFPTLVGPDTSPNGNADVFISKLNPAGTALVYSGFIGGSQPEQVGGVAVDSLGNAYVTGRTSSSTAQGLPAANRPDVTFGGNADAFVAKVPPGGGGFGYVTYLGGANLDDGEAITLDTGGNVYLVGEGRSSETQQFPVTIGPDLTFNGGGADVFVAKLGISADLSIGVSDAPDPVSAGQQLTYTLTVRNNGPDDALGITVTDPFPAGATFVSANSAQGTCTGTVRSRVQARRAGEWRQHECPVHGHTDCGWLGDQHGIGLVADGRSNRGEQLGFDADGRQSGGRSRDGTVDRARPASLGAP